jgi:pimeloyl-ACP methyl ester carboxylesterase/RimJ/RimL family protein N-acetyltransferase
MQELGPLRFRTHGDAGPLVIVLHGGPAAVGGATGLARGLSRRFRVLEPWQRRRGEAPLTVATHVADLHDLVRLQGGERPPALVGESWGAMLALAYAAAHPAGPLVLVGCGTFDLTARGRLQASLAEREERHRPLYDYAPLDAGPETEVREPFDLAGHTETWDDMVRLQADGVYPAAFAAISSPVLMLHGAYDPHPGQMIRASLRPYLPQLEYREWERCGHAPWTERFVRDEFFAVLSDWLARRLAQGNGVGGVETLRHPIQLPPALSDGVVRLDAHGAEDAAQMVAGEDEEIGRRFDGGRPTSLARADAFIRQYIARRAAGGPEVTYALRAPDGILMGGAEIRRPEAERVEVGYWVFPAFRGQRYARRALILLCQAAIDHIDGLAEISAQIEPDNPASLRTARAAGFSQAETVVENGVERLRFVRSLKS